MHQSPVSYSYSKPAPIELYTALPIKLYGIKTFYFKPASDTNLKGASQYQLDIVYVCIVFPTTSLCQEEDQVVSEKEM